MSNGAPDTGGVDIGHWSQVGGGIPGLNAVTKFASRSPEWSELAYQGGIHPTQIRQAAKDFNDTGAPTVGGDDGQRVLDAGLGDL